MRVKLEKTQFEYLIFNLLKKQELLRLKLQEVVKTNDFVIVETDEDTADEIRDIGSDELQRIGFDIDYILTNEGQILQQIIDIFYVGDSRDGHNAT